MHTCETEFYSHFNFVFHLFDDICNFLFFTVSHPRGYTAQENDSRLFYFRACQLNLDKRYEIKLKSLFYNVQYDLGYEILNKYSNPSRNKSDEKGRVVYFVMQTQLNIWQYIIYQVCWVCRRAGSKSVKPHVKVFKSFQLE